MFYKHFIEKRIVDEYGDTYLLTRNGLVYMGWSGVGEFDQAIFLELDNAVDFCVVNKVKCELKKYHQEFHTEYEVCLGNYIFLNFLSHEEALEFFHGFNSIIEEDSNV